MKKYGAKLTASLLAVLLAVETSGMAFAEESAVISEDSSLVESQDPDWETDLTQGAVLTSEGNGQNTPPDTPTAVTLEGSTLYANGTAILVAAGEDGNTYVYNGDGTEKLVEDPVNSSLTIYGGGKNTPVTGDVKITVDSVNVSRIYGGGYSDGSGNADITGNVSIVIKGRTEAGTVYGGGCAKATNGNASANVSGSVSVDISAVPRDPIGPSDNNSGKHCHNSANGGGYAYTNNTYSASADCGSVTLQTVSVIKQVIGGGTALAGSSAAGTVSANISGAVNLTLNETDIRDLYSGGYASGQNAYANAKSVSTNIPNGNEIAALYGGGWASDGGTATVAETVQVSVKNCSNIYGEIYGGGLATNGGIASVGSVSLAIADSKVPAYEQRPGWGVVAASLYGGGCSSGAGSVSDVNESVQLDFRNLDCSGSFICGGEADSGGSAKTGAITASFNIISSTDFEGTPYLPSAYAAIDWDQAEGTNAEPASCSMSLTDSSFEGIYGGKLVSTPNGDSPVSISGTSDLAITNSTISNSVACFDSIRLNDGPLNLQAFLFKSTPGEAVDHSKGTPTQLTADSMNPGDLLVTCADTDSSKDWFTLKDGNLEYIQNENGKSVWKVGRRDWQISLSKASSTLAVGDSEILKATLPASQEQSVQWSSDAPKIASVDERGIVTAHQPGSAQITASLTSENSAVCSVTVIPKAELPAGDVTVKTELTEAQTKIITDAIQNTPECEAAFQDIPAENIKMAELTVSGSDPSQPEAATFLLPYSQIFSQTDINETNYQQYYFTIMHLSQGNDGSSSEAELLRYAATPQGLKITVSSFSPFAFAYTKATSDNGLLHTLDFDSIGGSQTAAQQAAENALTAAPANPRRSGYSFGGWYTDYGKKWDFAKDSLLCDTTLYANWIQNIPVYTVRFDTQGGSPVNAMAVVFGGRIFMPSAPSRQDFTFTGWYKEAACTTPWDFDTDTVRNDCTLYAGWAADAIYTVRFDTQGGTSVDSIAGLAKGSLLSRPQDPSRSFYAFQGWYLDSAGTVPWNFQQDTIQGDTLLYALWKPVSPATPAVKSLVTATTAIRLTWTKVPGVTGYVVYGYTGNSKTYDYRQVVHKDSSVTVTQKGLAPGTPRRYIIRSYKTLDGKNYYSGLSRAIITAVRPKASVIKSAIPGKKGTAAITLASKAKGAIGYAYCTSMDNKTFRIVAKGPKMPYVMKGLEKGRNYIKVRSYTKDINGKTIYGNWSKTVTVRVS